MIKTSISYDEGLLKENCTYSIGTNDGKEFRSVVYKGTKLLNGKPMMVFVTKDDERLTVNPSFHTFTITENKEKISNG
jgi:hypothetical protein|tara:strand:+ start:938 stop:1171 length:234 start_codon:yes stop_codon:yes gene_type:complete